MDALDIATEPGPERIGLRDDTLLELGEPLPEDLGRCFP